MTRKSSTTRRSERVRACDEQNEALTTELHAAQSGESWLAQREDRESLLANVTSLITSCEQYIQGRSITSAQSQELQEKLDINRLIKAIGAALHAHSFRGFKRRPRNGKPVSNPKPPDETFATQLQDFAAVYVVNAGPDLVKALQGTVADPMIDADTGADWCRLYSELMLCQMVLGFSEMKAADFRKRQSHTGRNRIGVRGPFRDAIEKIAKQEGTELESVLSFLEKNDADDENGVEEWYHLRGDDALPIHDVMVDRDTKKVHYKKRDGTDEVRAIATIERILRDMTQ